jgi:hypothetical protein
MGKIKTKPNDKIENDYAFDIPYFIYILIAFLLLTCIPTWIDPSIHDPAFVPVSGFNNQTTYYTLLNSTEMLRQAHPFNYIILSGISAVASLLIVVLNSKSVSSRLKKYLSHRIRKKMSKYESEVKAILSFAIFMIFILALTILNFWIKNKNGTLDHPPTEFIIFGFFFGCVIGLIAFTKCIKDKSKIKLNIHMVNQAKIEYIKYKIGTCLASERHP